MQNPADHLETTRLAELAQTLVAIPSITNQEYEIADALIRSGLLNGRQYCLIPEPSLPATLTIGARGRHVFHLAFRGKTSHATYDEGIKAVVDAAKAIAHLEGNRPRL